MSFVQNLKIAVTVASGLEKTAKKELERLGFENLSAINGKIEFNGDFKDVCRLNVCLRTVERVYIKLAEFDAYSYDELFENVSKIPFEQFIDKRGEVIVNGKCVKSKLYGVSACQSIIKNAVCSRLQNKYKVNWLSEDGARYEIVFSIFKDKAEILLNTSGDGLHKRGYRDKVWIAPIKETLASGLILMSDFYHARPLLDPFCGSGTIAIEGAMIALDIAPNKNRKFAFESWNCFDKNIKNAVLEECVSKEKLDRKIEIFGSDIDKKAIELSKYHLERAGLKGRVNFSVKNVCNLTLPSEIGTIVTNPPYGERVYDKQEAEDCIKGFSNAVKLKEGWSKFIITSAKNFEKIYGRKADRERKLYNSEKECRFYYYYSKKETK